MQRTGIGDIGGRPLDEVHHVIKGSTEIQFVAVLLDIPDVGRTDAVLQAQQGMAWPQVVDDTGLTAQLGIYGEAANFLLDADGSIIARDVRGADLDALLRRCLGPGEGP